MPKLTSPTGKPIVLKPIRPNAGLAVAYRRKIMQLVDAMQASLERYAIAAYRREDPETVAMDAPPPLPDGGIPWGTRSSQSSETSSSVAALKARMEELAARWIESFNDLAPKIAASAPRAIPDQVRSTAKNTENQGAITDSGNFQYTPHHQQTQPFAIKRARRSSPRSPAGR